MTSIDESASISVVITCYKEGNLLREAVASALSQSPQEVVIVNDASPDARTNAVCRDLESHPDVLVIWRQQNGGPSVARNHGFEKARSDILVPLDADDLLPENALKSLGQAFKSNSNIGFVYGPYMRQDALDRPAQSVFSRDISLETMLSAQPFSLSSRWQLLGTTPIRKAVWQSVGKYDPTFGSHDLHDVEFWIRVLNSGCQYVAVRQPIYIWRKYLGRNSRQITPLSWYQIARKYFGIYCSANLDYRAYELLLLGSQWENRLEEAKLYRSKLWQCIKQGNYQFSSLVAIAIPARLFKFLAQQASKKR